MPSVAAPPNLTERLDAVERLVQMFRIERIVHLLVTSISLAMLLFSAGVLIYRAGADIPVLVGLFGSSGLISYSAGRLLKMWDQALQVLQVKGAKK